MKLPQRKNPDITRRYITVRRLLSELKFSTQRNQVLVALLLKDENKADKPVGDSLDVVSLPGWIFKQETN